MSEIKRNLNFSPIFQMIGIACVEQNERTFSVIQFEDNDFYTELEATIVILGPKEALLPSMDGDFKNIATLLERNNVMTTLRKKKDYSLEKSDLVQDLNNLLHFEKDQKEDSNALAEMKLTLAMSSLNAAIKVGQALNTYTILNYLLIFFN